ncbi:MAG: hypothetical protein LBM97_00645, partial [Candidatus Nomurabacteria bacterium]|nr:hypothetical protein [Candidatus Nomurabacteria bacterium]
MKTEKNPMAGETGDILKNIEAEKSVLGAIIIDNNVLIDLNGGLAADDFFLGEHQIIMAGILSLYEKHQPIDFLTLSNELTMAGKLKEVGGSTYLTELTNFVPSTTHARAYAKILKHNSLRRKLLKAGDDIAHLANDGE